MSTIGDLADFEQRAGLMVGRRGHVAVVLLNRPARGNAFDTAMKQELPRIWQGIDDDVEVRAIVLGSTSDRFFCTGRDVKEVAEEGVVGADRAWRRSFQLTTRHLDIWKPVICAVEGRVVGGGLHFVVDADIVIAGETATFADSHVNVGFVGAVENLGLALKAGLGTALYLTLIGKSVSIDARRAYALGLVQEVVAPGSALNRAMALAEIIAGNSPSAVRRSQEAIWGLAYAGSYEEAIRHGWLLLRRQWDHPDSTEGPRAFAEGRDPEWTDD